MHTEYTQPDTPSPTHRVAPRLTHTGDHSYPVKSLCASSRQTTTRVDDAATTGR